MTRVNTLFGMIDVMSDTEVGDHGRRTLLRALTLGGAGTAAGIAAGAVFGSAEASPGTPRSALGVPSAGPWRPVNGHVDVTWAVNTSEKLVALTFDDGPMPNWTPMVHDILDEERAKATFFLIGRRLLQHARLVHGRMDRHEAGNHTWAHQDLSHLDHKQAYAQIERSHAAIARITGKEPRHLRPPFGNIGGTTLSAAGSLGYDLVLWSIKMLEKTYQKHPPRLVDYIVGNTERGTILLAHDTGHHDRLVALRNLAAMIRGLRAKGFEFVTVSELIQAGVTAPGRVPAP
jgi:peptidoglycan/xylan/chitin deacetylase (PgdA/CDA1 family)